MGFKYKMSLLLINTIIILIVEADNFSNMTTDAEKNNGYRVLSRRKRFITFPDGSSFQLVFCAQNQGYIQIGDIVWFGNTAALAWELPTDPIIFQSLKKHGKVYGADGAQRRQDNKHVIYLDEDGKVISTRPYRRKIIVNPAFAKRSVDKVNMRTSISRKNMHDSHNHSNYFDDLDEKSIKFHRDGRKSLYKKLENLLKGLGWQGNECVHRLICENKFAKHTQGTFLDEILRLTFTLPKTGILNLSDEYDEAFGRKHCDVYECEITQT